MTTTSRVMVKEEVVGSWLEAVQLANAAVMLGLGVTLENESVQGKAAEYRLEIYNAARWKAKPEASFEMPTENLELEEMNGPKNPMGYL